MKRYIDEQNAALAELAKENTILRAMLCQLRVYQTTKHQRTGWAVTAFIPNSVLEGIKDGADKEVRDAQKYFLKERVVASLVDLALRGVWDVVEGRLKSVCVVYRPLEVTKVDEHGRILDIKVPTQKDGAPHVILEKDAGDDDDSFEAYDPMKASTWRKK
jgi:hypothetical protein